MAENESVDVSFINPTKKSYIYDSKSSGNRNRIILITLGILILVALVVFAVIATGGKGEVEKNLTPTPTKAVLTPTKAPPPTPSKTAPTATPKVTPTPSTLDRASLKVTVLNGSGAAGVATKASDVLKKLGYDVISSGNADNFDYAKTVIQVKASKKAYLELLKSDLSGNYTIGSATADYTGSSDAVVIVGKE